jgi:hypothetical protein
MHLTNACAGAIAGANASPSPCANAGAFIPSHDVVNIVSTPEQKQKMRLIKHVFFCNSDPCKYIDCRNLRHQISHVKNNCIIEHCVECASYHENILTSHVKICKSDICPVPKCLETRTINNHMVIDLTMD